MITATTDAVQESTGPRPLDDCGAVLERLAVPTMVGPLDSPATEVREPSAALRFPVHRGLAPVTS